MAIILAVFCSPPVVADEEPSTGQHVIVVIGAAGTDEYAVQFREWAERWEQAAVAGTARCRVLGLEPDTSVDDRLGMTTLFSEWSAIETTEPLWIVLIGHGTHDGRSTRFNLRGPDITAEETTALLNKAARPVALINCTSCSAPFINAASGPGRVIISATKDGGQYQFTRFGDYLSQAINDMQADLDRDGQVSLLEAWVFASQRTGEFYESAGRLATEHALLDDNGDELGSRESAFAGVRLQPPEEQDNPDGRLARNWHLVRSDDERRLSPEQRQQRDELEQKLDELKKRADDFSEDAWLDELEKILIPLARIYAEADAS